MLKLQDVKMGESDYTYTSINFAPVFFVLGIVVDFFLSVATAVLVAS